MIETHRPTDRHGFETLNIWFFRGLPKIELTVLWCCFINEEISQWNVHKSGKSSLHLRAKVGVVPTSILTKLCWYEDQICFTTLGFDAYSYLATVQRNHVGKAPPKKSQRYRKDMIIECNRKKRNIDQQAIKDVMWNAELQNNGSEKNHVGSATPRQCWFFNKSKVEICWQGTFWPISGVQKGEGVPEKHRATAQTQHIFWNAEIKFVQLPTQNKAQINNRQQAKLGIGSIILRSIVHIISEWEQINLTEYHIYIYF
jgi:hypothetical protein